MKKFFKIVLILFIALIVAYVLSWPASKQTYPVTYGISFNQDHAASLGLDWKKVYVDMLKELKPSYVRIAAMWSNVEAEKGVYNFSDVDFMMREATKAGVKVTLVVGQKAPRWPECHIPAWVDDEEKKTHEHLSAYIDATVNRYKHAPALELWQVENEPYVGFKFGSCEQYDIHNVKQEVALVRSLDPLHKILVTDSGELGIWYFAGHVGDYFGTTVYRVVRLPNGWIFRYDWMPPAIYRWKGWLFGISQKRMVVSELQGEPWFTESNPMNTPIDVQEKTMNPERLTKHLDYATHIGVSRAYLWGVEWWYFMKEERNDPRYWNLVREWITGEMIDKSL